MNYLVAILVKNGASAAEIFDEAGEDGLLQDLLLLVRGLLKNAGRKIHLVSIIFLQDVLFHHLFKLQAQKVYLFHGFDLKTMLGAKLYDELLDSFEFLLFFVVLLCIDVAEILHQNLAV